MSSVIAFEPRRFESAAPYYLEGRPAYSGRLIDRVAKRLALTDGQRLLDLGTGPGQLAVAFAPYVSEVTGIDPEPEMLRIAGEQAEKAGVKLTLLEGSSYTLDEALGQFDVVTIGRAFHWMDRKRTVEVLDRLVTPDGAIALFATRHPTAPENRWVEHYDALIESHSEPNSTRRLRRSADWVPHESLLLASPFSQLERIGIVERRTTTVDRIVSRALSLSTNSRGRIGEQADALASKLREAILPFATNGDVQEVVESEALLAFRG